MSEDAFEPVRRAILAAQETLRAEELVYSETLRIVDERCRRAEINATELGYWQEQLLRPIRQTERRIVELKQMMPPHTVQRDGYLERLPVWEPIDPRQPPTS